jgi:hypothetical protein
MKLFFLLACPVLLSLSIQAQRIMIGDKEGDRVLTWADFRGKPDASSSFAALTSWNLRINMKSKTTNGGPATMEALEIVLAFNPEKSWVKPGKTVDPLLKHEQGHFDIGRLCLLEMLTILKSIPPKDQVNQLPAIYQRLMLYYEAMGNRYDQETNHSLNRSKQEEWDRFLEAEENRLRALL